MIFRQQEYTVILIVSVFCFFSHTASAVHFEPGVGVGAQYTNNAALASEDESEDLIVITSVGARLFEDEGALTYDASGSFNNQVYTQGTFVDQRNFNLFANADWEMIKERFNWFLSDRYTQSTINTSNANTPNNLQDINVFTLGANIRTAITARQNFSLVPTYTKYYYEATFADNEQYSLTANWSYYLSRLTSTGLIFSVQDINYNEEDIVGQVIADTRISNIAITFDGQRLRSTFSVNLGSTRVKRDNGDEVTGFTGHLSWLANLSSRSNFETLASTNISDASSEATKSGDFALQGTNNVQIVADILRSSIFRLAYIRNDALLRTRIWSQYNKLNYSNDLLDRLIRSYGIEMDYPVTQLLSSGVYANYNRTKQTELNPVRLDESYSVGGNLRYHFSPKLNGLIDVKYRTKESTVAGENYDEFSVFASLIYGFGEVRRPSSTGGL